MTACGTVDLRRSTSPDVWPWITNTDRNRVYCSVFRSDRKWSISSAARYQIVISPTSGKSSWLVGPPETAPCPSLANRRQLTPPPKAAQLCESRLPPTVRQALQQSPRARAAQPPVPAPQNPRDQHSRPLSERPPVRETHS